MLDEDPPGLTILVATRSKSNDLEGGQRGMRVPMAECRRKIVDGEFYEWNEPRNIKLMKFAAAADVNVLNVGTSQTRLVKTSMCTGKKSCPNCARLASPKSPDQSFRPSTKARKMVKEGQQGDYVLFRRAGK